MEVATAMTQARGGSLRAWRSLTMAAALPIWLALMEMVDWPLGVPSGISCVAVGRATVGFAGAGAATVFTVTGFAATVVVAAAAVVVVGVCASAAWAAGAARPMTAARPAPVMARRVRPVRIATMVSLRRCRVRGSPTDPGLSGIPEMPLGGDVSAN